VTGEKKEMAFCSLGHHKKALASSTGDVHKILLTIKEDEVDVAD